MAIVKMKKIQLLALRSQKDELLRELMLLGCVEVSEPDALISDPEIAALCARDDSGPDALRADHTSLSRALEIIGKYAPSKSGLFAKRPEITDDTLLDETKTPEMLELARELEQLDNRIRRLVTEETGEQSLIESLTPWESLRLPLNFDGTQRAAVLQGTVPITTDFTELCNALNDAVSEAEAFSVSIGKELRYLTVVYLRERQQEVFDALRRFGFSPSPFKSTRGTAAENIKSSVTKLTKLASERSDLISRIAAAADRKSDLQLCFDQIGTKIARAEAAEKLLGTEKTVLLTGWITAPDEPALIVALSKYACAWELCDPEQEEYDDVPVKLKNNKLTEPLNMVTEMYSLPAYGGIDPNPLIMPFYCIFFGIMYADMGYGAVLVILGILCTRLMKPRGTLKYAAGLLKLCGVTSFIFGLLFGGFFGDALPVLSDLLGFTHIEMWSLIDPLANPMVALIGSLAIGMFQILVGMGIKGYMQIRDGHLLDAVLDILPWWLTFAGIALIALGITPWALVAGAVALVLTQGRSKPSISGKLISGFASLYDITGFFGDILSYTRLMALMMAGSVIASVFNMLGSLTGNIIGFIIVFLFGHILNMVLNIIGTFVHAARLQYLEFFGKFYVDGGRPFSPLAVKTKYADIIKEEK